MTACKGHVSASGLFERRCDGDCTDPTPPLKRGRGRPPTGRAARSQIVWPPGLLARARWAAEHQGLSLSEYVRWCVVADLEEFTSRDQSGTAKTDAEG